MKIRKFDWKKERQIKKNARRALKSAGHSLLFFILIFNLIKNNLIIPFISKVWGLTLMTTPEGFISNANIVNALIKSPWVILIALIIIILYAAISLWQVCAVFLGIEYINQNKRIKIFDLFKVSAIRVVNGCRPKNWMLLVYTLIIVPFANVYQTSEMINAFVIPEYIADFIYSNIFLSVLVFVLFIAAIYFALRWFYLLPSFILKNNSFKDASKESFEITKDSYIRKGISLIIYNLVESLRFSILPIVIILGLGGVFYFFTKDIKLSEDIFNMVFKEKGVDAAGSIISTFAYLSIMCYLYQSYVNKLEENNQSSAFELPDIKKEAKNKKHSVMIDQMGISLVFALVLGAVYFILVFAAKYDITALSPLFSETSIVAHKGYSSKAPENTMPAFELADKSDAVDFIELDVWSSKDGIPVVLHNESIKAATGNEGNVGDYTYAQLQEMSAPYNMDKEEYENARIPSLEEVLLTYADTTPILIEIKGYGVDEQLPSKIVDLMDKYNCKYSSMIHSGDYQALKAVKMCDPNIKCGLIEAVVTGNCYDLPYADFISVEHTFVNSNMVSQLHKRGKQIYVWTVNYDESAEKLQSLKVDGIITDYPDDIDQYVKSNNEAFEDFLTLNPIKENSNMTDAISGFESGEY